MNVEVHSFCTISEHSILIFSCLRRRLKDCSQVAIATAFCVLHLMGCMEFSVVIAIELCEHLR